MFINLTNALLLEMIFVYVQVRKSSSISLILILSGASLHVSI